MSSAMLTCSSCGESFEGPSCPACKASGAPADVPPSTPNAPSAKTNKPRSLFFPKALGYVAVVAAVLLATPAMEASTVELRTQQHRKMLREWVIRSKLRSAERSQRLEFHIEFKRKVAHWESSLRHVYEDASKGDEEAQEIIEWVLWPPPRDFPQSSFRPSRFTRLPEPAKPTSWFHSAESFHGGNPGVPVGFWMIVFYVLVVYLGVLHLVAASRWVRRLVSDPVGTMVDGAAGIGRDVLADVGRASLGRSLSRENGEGD